MKTKKQVVVLIALCLGCFLVTGCRPKVFGVSENVWNTLTPEERRQVIDGYQKLQEEKERNALIHKTAETLVLLS